MCSYFLSALWLMYNFTIFKTGCKAFILIVVGSPFPYSTLLLLAGLLSSPNRILIITSSLSVKERLQAAEEKDC